MSSDPILTEPMLNEQLEQLGARMSPSVNFVERVMARIDQQKKAASFADSFGWNWQLGVGGAVAAVMLLSVSLASWMHLRKDQADLPRRATPMPARYEQSTDRWEATVRRPVLVPGERPAWEYRQQEFEHVKWTDPASHATLERTVPRSGVLLIVLDNY